MTLKLKDGKSLSFLDVALTISESEKEIRVQKQIEDINRLIAANENVNFYVYVPANFSCSEFYGDYIPGETSNAKYVTMLLDGIKGAAGVGSLEIGSIEDRINKFYLTDHHWNDAGAFEGMSDIIAMMRNNAPEILPLKQPVNKIHITPCKFYGSFARSLAYPKLWDEFVVFDYGLSQHSISPDYDFYEELEFMQGAAMESISNNVYGSFYHDLLDIEYPGNNTGRNLLVLGDSYTRIAAERLASSFDVTKCYYQSDFMKLSEAYDNSYNKCIAENQITDVLLMLYVPRILFNAWNDYDLSIISTAEYITEQPSAASESGVND